MKMARRVALVTTQLPHPVNCGKRVVLNGFLKYFADRDITVDMIVLGEAVPVPPNFLDGSVYFITLDHGVVRLARAGFQALVLGRRSLQEALVYGRTTKRALRILLEQLRPDVVICDTIRVGQFFERPSDRLPVPYTVYLDDLFSERYRRLIARLQAGDQLSDVLGNFDVFIPRMVRPLSRLRAIQFLLFGIEHRLVLASEKRQTNRFGEVSLLNADEVARLRARCPDANVHLIRPNIAFGTYSRDPGSAARAARFVILGAWQYPPNVIGLRSFLDQVMPILGSTLPAARIRIVGGGMSPNLRSVLSSFAPQLEVTGFVEDLQAELASSTAMLVPLRAGTGIKIKTLQALAAGLPVISTNVGVEGIGVTSGQQAIVENDLRRFPEHMAALCQPEANAALSHAAQDFFRNHFSTAKIYEQYDGALLACCPGKPN